MCVTRGPMPAGPLGHRLAAPVIRAVAAGTRGDAAALAFTYRGPSAATVRLGSGQLRRQLGLKLRAADGCNAVYVMWRLEPRPGLEVSVKLNPGEHTHAACGTGGYAKARAAWSAPVPTLLPGARHTLAASIAGDELTATVDGVAVWRGALGPGARGLVGPVGLRSDNVDIDAELLAADDPRAPRGCPEPASADG